MVRQPLDLPFGEIIHCVALEENEGAGMGGGASQRRRPSQALTAPHRGTRRGGWLSEGRSVCRVRATMGVLPRPW